MFRPSSSVSTSIHLTDCMSPPTFFILFICLRISATKILMPLCHRPFYKSTINPRIEQFSPLEAERGAMYEYVYDRFIETGARYENLIKTRWIWAYSAAIDKGVPVSHGFSWDSLFRLFIFFPTQSWARWLSPLQKHARLIAQFVVLASIHIVPQRHCSWREIFILLLKWIWRIF